MYLRSVMIVAAIAWAAYLLFSRLPPRPVLLCCGDSIVSGYGLPAADAFPAQVPTRRPDLRVVAAGLAGDASGNVARYESDAPSRAVAHP